MVKINTDITPNTAAQGFAALGSDARLSVVLTLVRAGEKGLSVGDLQKRTGIAASTLAHHLRTLAGARLIRQEKNGRAVINHAQFTHLGSLGWLHLRRMLRR